MPEAARAPRVAGTEERATGISARLARHVACAVPTAEARVAARRSLLDAVGVSLAASGIGEGCAAFATLGRTMGGGDCTLIGHGACLSAPAAALANGALAHAIDFEDVFDESPIHPNACTVAAALAISEHRGGVSGRDLLAAIALGADLVCRLALALDSDPGERGWYTPPILGAYGAAAAAARLLRLSAEQTEQAFALTLSQVTCPAQFKTSPRSTLRAVRDGFATQGAVQAALLAEQGVCGFDEPFEGKAGLYALYSNGRFHADALVASLGEDFYGTRVSYKLWPACRGTHAFIESALAIRDRPSFAVDHVQSIEARGSAFLAFLCEPAAQKAAPNTAIDAKFSIPFCIALALLEGDPGLDSYGPDRLADPLAQALAARVQFVPSDGDSRQSAAGRLIVHMVDGTMHTHEVAAARGHPDAPLTDGALEAKFRSCARLTVSPPSIEATACFPTIVRQLDEDLDGDAGSRLLHSLHAPLEDLHA